MNYNNMSYSIKRTYLGTKYYSCNKYKINKCPAKLIVKSDGTIIPKNEHTCVNENRLTRTDVEQDMIEYIERECTKNLFILPSVIWRNAVKEMNKIHKNNPILMVQKQYAIDHIKYIRKQIHGTNDYRKIETVPICNISENDTRKFLQLNMYISHNNLATRIIAFGHPDLIRLLNYPSTSLFIDGKFKICPIQFIQCLIVMIYDPSVDVYVPILYILINSKEEWAYSNVLHWIHVPTDFKINPQIVTCDFEKALINAINKQFPNATIIGCLFHFKQALRRKLMALRIDRNQIHKAMGIGQLDLLTIIPPDEIIKYGIPYVRCSIDEGNNVAKCNKFWSYFIHTWMKMYPPEFWNISGAISNNISITNRTNNPLESYNRLFASQFPSCKPSLLLFTEICKKESIKYTDFICAIKQGIAKAPLHNTTIYPTVSIHYLHFKNELNFLESQ